MKESLRKIRENYFKSLVKKLDEAERTAYYRYKYIEEREYCKYLRARARALSYFEKRCRLLVTFILQRKPKK